jgi:hypothetical protein
MGRGGHHFLSIRLIIAFGFDSADRREVGRRIDHSKAIDVLCGARLQNALRLVRKEIDRAGGPPQPFRHPCSPPRLDSPDPTRQTGFIRRLLLLAPPGQLREALAIHIARRSANSSIIRRSRSANVFACCAMALACNVMLLPLPNIF